jgi:hypothetical protein
MAREMLKTQHERTVNMTQKAIAIVDRLGYFWCAACAAAREKVADVSVDASNGSYENDRCDGCDRLMVLNGVHPRRYGFAATKFRKGDRVRVGRRYIMGGRSERDEYTDRVFYVVEVSGFISRPGGPADYGLAARPDADADVWIIEGRLTAARAARS